jgi:hypothetical protein
VPTLKTLTFDAQLAPGQADVFARACGLLGVPADDRAAAAIAREALVEWCEWLDARGQFPTVAEQRRYRIARLFGRIVPALTPGVLTPERVRKVLPFLTSRQIANQIAYVAEVADPLYRQVSGAQLKAKIDDALVTNAKAQVVSVWVDLAVAPLLQQLLDDAFKAGELLQQVKGAEAGDWVKFSSIKRDVWQAVSKKLAQP